MLFHLIIARVVSWETNVSLFSLLASHSIDSILISCACQQRGARLNAISHQQKCDYLIFMRMFARYARFLTRFHHAGNNHDGEEEAKGENGKFDQLWQREEQQLQQE